MKTFLVIFSILVCFLIIYFFFPAHSVMESRTMYEGVTSDGYSFWTDKIVWDDGKEFASTLVARNDVDITGTDVDDDGLFETITIIKNAKTYTVTDMKVIPYVEHEEVSVEFADASRILADARTNRINAKAKVQKI
jgi:lipopolysaccharide export LptBFGC system permease protein LptF